MSAGVMIGSGVFLLPAVLAPYGSISFLGWLFTSAGAIVIALTLGRLAGRTDESGGFYVYVRSASARSRAFSWGGTIGLAFFSPSRPSLSPSPAISARWFRRLPAIVAAGRYRGRHDLADYRH